MGLVKGWIRKGKILQGMQQYSKALSAFQKAMELDPNATVRTFASFASQAEHPINNMMIVQLTGSC